MHWGGTYVLGMARYSILVDYWLWSFSPWLTSFLLDVAMGGDVVQDSAQVIFNISKTHHSTKPTVTSAAAVAATAAAATVA